MAFGVKQKDRGGYRATIRVLDVFFSALLLVALSPFFLLIALLIRLDSKGPAFFTHERIGKNGRIIRIYKFRSMRENAEELISEFSPEQRALWDADYKLDDDPRVTRVGNFLRKTYLDELPQLMNVLKGELSMVGPRPVVAEELEKYGENKQKFLSITPGLTGYWQVYADKNCTYQQRMEMELFYVEHASLRWNLKIAYATLRAIFGRKGR